MNTSIYRQGKRWYFTINDGNAKPIAISTRSYSRDSDAKKALKRILRKK